MTTYDQPCPHCGEPCRQDPHAFTADSAIVERVPGDDTGLWYRTHTPERCRDRLSAALKAERSFSGEVLAALRISPDERAVVVAAEMFDSIIRDKSDLTAARARVALLEGLLGEARPHVAQAYEDAACSARDRAKAILMSIDAALAGAGEGKG